MGKKIDTTKKQKQPELKPVIEEVQKKSKKIKKCPIDLDHNLVKKAARILLDKHNEARNERNLLDINEQFVYLEINLGKVPEHYSIKPIQIKLAHPIYSQKFQSRFAIFVSDPQRIYKDKVQDLDIPLIGKAIGYTKLIKKYPGYQDKRKLANDYDLFFSDSRIYTLLPKLVGKFFYDRKKIPFPIDCEKVPEKLQSKFSSYEEYLNDLSNYSYFIMGNGPSYTLKIARVSMDPNQIEENIKIVLPQILRKLRKCGIDLEYVQQVSLKTFNSFSLPIYNHIPKEYIEAYLAGEKK